ncbi:hypothetical protein ACFTSF_08895 [Kribbella sp. NPDC056951]|uniref:hypothetical protein n=1 Tax=Kribbella sp. NPDC056951 TaxID=3345978 RepID=UPI003628C478
MELLACGHLANEGPFRTCLHLCVEEPEEISRLYTGVGGEYHLVCETCGKLDDPWSQLAVVCLGCTERADDEKVTHISGQPEIRYDDRPLTGTFHEEPAYAQPVNDRCLAPSGDGWLVYTGKYLVQLGGASYRLKMRKDQEDDKAFGTPGPTVHASSDGRFAAVVWDHGRYGEVVDLAKGQMTVTLDRGDYRNYTTPFPFAFLADGTFITATSWNRLDRVNSASGSLLTPRDTKWRKGDERPENYLDYFHGRLTVSPTGAWLVDDGWVWAPVGIPLLIDVAAWQNGTTYAAEQGRSLTYRDYAWNQPVAWLTDNVVAIQRIGEDDAAMVDGVQLYDAPSGERVDTLFGPKGQMWAVDGQLAVAAEHGLEFWDPAEGARVGVLPGYRPSAYNPRTRTFAALEDWVLRTYQLPIVAAANLCSDG